MVLRLLLLSWFGLTGLLPAAPPDFAATARAGLDRLDEGGRQLAAAEQASARAPADQAEDARFRLTLARSAVRAIGLEEFAALRTRRGALVETPAKLLAAERALGRRCRLLEFEAACRSGCIAEAERELALARPWVEPDDAATWTAAIERTATMAYQDEPEVPDGEEVLFLASDTPPDDDVAARVEKLARDHPGRLRAQFPRLVFYRRTGREKELDAAVAELRRACPHNRALRHLADDIRASFERF